MPLKDEVLTYLQEIKTVLQNSDLEPGERNTLVENVRSELRGQELNLARHQQGSRLLEELFPYCTSTLLLDFFKVFNPALVDLSFHAFGSRVLEHFLTALDQTILRSPSPITADDTDASELLNQFSEAVLNLEGEANQEGGGDDEPSPGWGWVELLADAKASHVLRKFIEILVEPEVEFSNKPLPVFKQTVRTRFPVLKTLWELFLKIMKGLLSTERSEKRLKTLKQAAHHTYLSPSLQMVLKALRKISSSKFLQANQKTQMKPLQEQAVQFTTTLLQLTLNHQPEKLIRHRIASHYFEEALPSLSDSEYYDYYVKHFRHRLFELSQDKTANFVLQKFIGSARDAPQASLIINELLEKLPECFPHRTGVVAQLIHIGVKYATLEKELYSRLLHTILGERAAHPKEFVPALYEKLVPREDSSLHGFSELLIPALLLPLQYSKVIGSSILQLPTETIVKLCLNPSGSRLIESLFQSKFPAKFKNKAFLKLKGNWVTIAKNKSGSRCLDSIFQVANVQQKELLTSELVEREHELRNDFFGRFAIINCKVDQFKLKKDHWQASIGKRDKKRTMFAELLEDKDSSDQPPAKKKKPSSDSITDTDTKDTSRVSKQTSKAKQPPAPKQESVPAKQSGNTTKKKQSKENKFSSADHKRIMAALTSKPMSEEEFQSSKQTPAVDEEIDALFNSKKRK